MKETKTYYIGWNRYEGKAISYSTQEHAEKSGNYWKQINSTSYREAKEQFLEDVRENHSEME